MLEKTRQLLAKYKPGEYVSDESLVFDEGEIRALARLLRPLVYAPSQVRRFLQDEGVTITPSNYYSEIPTIRDIEASFEGEPVQYGGLFDDDLIRTHLEKLIPFGAEFSPPVEGDLEVGRYFWNAPMYSYCDAMSYYAMVRLVQPKSIVEIGSGFSTLVALEALGQNDVQGRMTCIEPYPRAFLRERDDITLVDRLAQDITTEFLNDSLSDGDILFIDSTHTVKHGSDCLHIYLKLLPGLQREVYVHVHDIYLPDPLPLSMARDRQLYWTEQYLLAAYLTENPRTQILYGSSFSSKKNPKLLTELMHGKYRMGGASVWFHQNTR